MPSEPEGEQEPGDHIENFQRKLSSSEEYEKIMRKLDDYKIYLDQNLFGLLPSWRPLLSKHVNDQEQHSSKLETEGVW